MRLLSKEDILGAKIVAIHSQLYEQEYVCILFTTDRGDTFTMPWPGHAWGTSELSSEAQLMADDEGFYEPIEVADASIKPVIWWKRCLRCIFGLDLKPNSGRRLKGLVGQIKQRTIAQVVCPPMDEELGFYCPDEVFLVFTDGATASVISTAHPNTGSNGLYFHLGNGQAWRMPEGHVDFFDVPLVED